MKALVVYDSVYGNTGTIAEAIGDAIAGEVQVLRSSNALASDLEGIELLIVGAPTHGGRPTDGVQAFLDATPAGALTGVTVAGFDTRLTARWVRIFGYAAPKIAAALQDKGGLVGGEPGDFFVKGRRGPLVAGEKERAAAWAKAIVRSMSLD